jgi:pyruvate formate lyase activating enzyme
MKEAMFYEKLGDNVVKCNLCSHRCKITDSKKGICAVRENRNGTLYSLVYGKGFGRTETERFTAWSTEKL